MTDFRDLADALIPHVLEAGRIAMRRFRERSAPVIKIDGSPVTDADREVEAALVAALACAAPGIPVIAEEMMDGRQAAAPGDVFFLVDPIDGTSEFVSSRDEFTINIGLVRDRIPRFGIVYAPAQSRLYLTSDSDTALAARVEADASVTRLAEIDTRPIRTRAGTESEPLAVVTSRSHGSAKLEGWLKTIDVGTVTRMGSSLKFCKVAEGEADVYPRFGRTREWDTAAGHAILSSAGGLVTGTDGSPLLYGKHDAHYVNPSFIAAARRMEGLFEPNPS